ncbi:uncharacterized protein LOC103708632 [Phoenix dactylifera]|uniref:Uncharacterized protein LOC103708632 n=1 Tax=Phoenix dactylifera TaxID=42345 RepID=A0A8B7MV51_PHODC|nr:uncharacterized protein LOC103708632 [Phoenix dactylifera]XP_008791875.3 uncharacterized protein LOC103708632 [Phoenix dactylifera]XP_017698703.3 uncharacterized protein LOC103708632 [Phoenix dactylifera]
MGLKIRLKPLGQRAAAPTLFKVMQKGFGGGIPMEVKKAGEGDAVGGEDSAATGRNPKQKPPFRPAKDDTKPLLRDPILRSDPMESERAVLRLPPFPRTNSQF